MSRRRLMVGPDGEGDTVAFDAAVADAAVSVGDEPGDGSFHHGAMLRVSIDSVTPVGAGLSEKLVVCGDLEGFPAGRRRR